MKSPEKIYLIDTNVILRYLMGDHPQFSPKAEAFMHAVFGQEIKAEIPAVVMVECTYVMEKYYKIPRGEIVGKLSAVLNFSGIVNPDKSELLKALLTYASSGFDIVDCILAAHSSPDKVVVSFDKDMDKLKAVREKL